MRTISYGFLDLRKTSSGIQLNDFLFGVEADKGSFNIICVFCHRCLLRKQCFGGSRGTEPDRENAINRNKTFSASSKMCFFKGF